MAKTQQKLFRSKQDRIIGGVCGGVGEYLDVDPTWVRLIWTLASLGGGFGVIAYAIAWFIVPENPSQKIGGKKDYEHITKKAKDIESYVKNNNERSAGIFLVIIGSIFLLNTFYNISLKIILPSLLILAGMLMLSKNKQK